jgi:hypothetical protein
MIQKSCKFLVLHHGSDEDTGGAEISGKESAAAEIPGSRSKVCAAATSRQPEGVFPVIIGNQCVLQLSTFLSTFLQPP